MSAPPPGRSHAPPGAPMGTAPLRNGPEAGAAAGPPRPGPGTTIRRVVKADPLVARKRVIPKPALSRPPKGVTPDSAKAIQERRIEEQKMAQIKELQKVRGQNGGWTQPAPPDAVEFPLVMTKRAMLEGMRHHIMRLNHTKAGRGSEHLDVTNQDHFPRPVTLHRRDPRLPPASRMVVKDESAPLDPAEAAEAERQRQMKADKEAQRALDQAQIAPVAKGNDPKPKQPQNNKKDKASAFYGRTSEEHKKQSGLRYEETFPWHLEDAEGKAGVWVGSYVAGLSDINVALVIDGYQFRMIPLQRWYRFDEKPKFDTLSLDDAERMMYEQKEIKRWVMQRKEKELLEKEKNETRHFLRGPIRVKMESATSRASRHTERQDDFELDMSGDEFQDDDETPGFEADDEDTKDAKGRIRREQVGANLFGEGEEDKVEQEEREKQLEKLKRKIGGKQTIKSLKELEHAMDFEDLESDSDGNNPFSESSEDEEEDRKDEVKKEDEGAAKKPEQGASGANTKGNTTPSGKSKTAVDGNKKVNKLKRAGSPNISDSSDNEAVRKKIKTGKGSVVPSRGATPIPGRPKIMPGATSDGEATAGEASDGGSKLKNKIKLKSRTGATPSGSRAGSPAPTGLAAQAASPTQAGSASPAASPPPSTPAADRIQAWEIVQAVKPYAKEGISLGNLLRLFHKRIDKPGSITKAEWIQLVKANAQFCADKLLRPKPGA